MVMLPPGGPNQGERITDAIYSPLYPGGPGIGDLSDLAPGTPAWSVVTPWVYGLPVQGSKVPRTCVTHGGSTYVAIKDDLLGTVVPGTDPTVWVCVAQGILHAGNAAAMAAIDPVANAGAVFLRTDMGTGAQAAWFVAIDGAWRQTTAVY